MSERTFEDWIRLLNGDGLVVARDGYADVQTSDDNDFAFQGVLTAHELVVSESLYLEQQTVTTSIDFNAGPFASLTIGSGGGTTTIGASSNLADRQTVLLFISGPTSSAETLAFPAGWTWFGEQLPSSIGVGQNIAILLHSLGSSDGLVLASVISTNAEMQGVGDLTDVDMTLGHGAGKILVSDGTKFIPVLGTGLYQPLDGDLSDIAALSHTDGNMIVSDGTDWEARTRRDQFPIAQFQYNNSGALTISDISSGSTIPLHTEDFEDTGFTHAASATAVQCDFDGVVEVTVHARCEITSGTRGWFYLEVDLEGTAVTGLANSGYVRSGAGDDKGGTFVHGFVTVADGEELTFRIKSLDNTTTLKLNDDDFNVSLRRVG